MREHLEAVAGRALIVPRPARDRDLKDILGHYGADAGKPPKPGTRVRANR
jgi:hypothetical protein